MGFMWESHPLLKIPPIFRYTTTHYHAITAFRDTIPMHGVTVRNCNKRHQCNTLPNLTSPHRYLIIHHITLPCLTDTGRYWTSQYTTNTKLHSALLRRYKTWLYCTKPSQYMTSGYVTIQYHDNALRCFTEHNQSPRYYTLTAPYSTEQHLNDTILDIALQYQNVTSLDYALPMRDNATRY